MNNKVNHQLCWDFQDKAEMVLYIRKEWLNDVDAIAHLVIRVEKDPSETMGTEEYLSFLVDF